MFFQDALNYFLLDYSVLAFFQRDSKLKSVFTILYFPVDFELLKDSVYIFGLCLISEPTKAFSYNFQSKRQTLHWHAILKLIY